MRRRRPGGTGRASARSLPHRRGACKQRRWGTTSREGPATCLGRALLQQGEKRGATRRGAARTVHGEGELGVRVGVWLQDGAGRQVDLFGATEAWGQALEAQASWVFLPVLAVDTHTPPAWAGHSWLSARQGQAVTASSPELPTCRPR